MAGSKGERQLPPLPVSDTSLLRALADIERLASDPKTAFEATQRRSALVEEMRGVDPLGAAALVDAIGHDLGVLGGKTTALVQGARRGTLAALHVLAAEDPDFQRRALGSLPSEPMLRNELLRGLFSASMLTEEAKTFIADCVRDARPEARAVAAIAAQAAFRHGIALAMIGPLLRGSPGDDTNTLEHRAALLGAGGAHWSSAGDPWRPILAPIAALAETPYDWTKGDAGRAALQLGQHAAKALAMSRSGVVPVHTPSAPSATTTARPRDASLDTPAAREAALDAVGSDLVDALVAAGSDDTKARDAIAAAIARFYDIRDSADQPRGEYAGHFFRVDGVGLDATGRPVPWMTLRARLGDARADQLSALFDEIEAVTE